MESPPVSCPTLERRSQAGPLLQPHRRVPILCNPCWSYSHSRASRSPEWFSQGYPKNTGCSQNRRAACQPLQREASPAFRSAGFMLRVSTLFRLTGFPFVAANTGLDSGFPQRIRCPSNIRASGLTWGPRLDSETSWVRWNAFPDRLRSMNFAVPVCISEAMVTAAWEPEGHHCFTSGWSGRHLFRCLQ